MSVKVCDLLKNTDSHTHCISWVLSLTKSLATWEYLFWRSLLQLMNDQSFRRWRVPYKFLFYFVPSWLTSILHFDIHTWPSFPRYLWCLSVYAIIENKRRVSAGKKVPSRPSLLFRVTSSLNKRTFIILTKPFFLLIVIHRFLLIHGRTCGCGYEGSRLFARYLVRKVTKVTRCWQRWMKCLISSVILHERFPDNSWKLDSLSNLRKYVCSSICH